MLLQIDGTIIFVFISFGIFLWLMNLICYKPIMQIIEARENFYSKNKKTIYETDSKKQDIIKDYEEGISGAKLTGSKILKEAAEKNKNQKKEIIGKQKSDIQASLENFNQKLNLESDNVKNELYSEIDFFVKSTVARVLNIEEDKIDTSGLNKDKILK